MNNQTRRGKHLLFANRYWLLAISVGNDLFSRDVAIQVSWAHVSLTAVFGMGTGGSSRLEIPTIVNIKMRHLFCRHKEYCPQTMFICARGASVARELTNIKLMLS